MKNRKNYIIEKTLQEQKIIINMYKENKKRDKIKEIKRRIIHFKI